MLALGKTALDKNLLKQARLGLIVMLPYTYAIEVPHEARMQTA
jgi:hypothetical protein